MRCDLKEPGAGTQALGGEGNHTESWYRNWSWCISALPLRERGTHSCIQGLDGVPAHWKCHHSSTADLHEIREQLRPDCRGREAQLLNAYIKVIFFLCRCASVSKWELLKIFQLKCDEHLSVTKEQPEVLKTNFCLRSQKWVVGLRYYLFPRNKTTVGNQIFILFAFVFLFSSASLVVRLAEATGWKDTNCPFLGGAFISLTVGDWSSQQ